MIKTRKTKKDADIEVFRKIEAVLFQGEEKVGTGIQSLGIEESQEIDHIG